MKWFFDLREFIWPWLEKHTPKEKKRLKDDLTADEVRINALDLKVKGEIALEEARRLADSEAERRRGTDQKAATYLPLVAALIPLILTVVTAMWEKKAGSAPAWINMPLLALAVAYTASAGRWAFEELRVAVSHEPGLDDFEKAWGASHPAQNLARRLLLHTRRNREGVNWKVSCIIMAHAFLLRAFLTFALLLLINIGWYFFGSIFGGGKSHPEPHLKTPQEAIAAMSEVDRLSGELQRIDGWTVLAADCRRRSDGHASLTMIPEPTTAIMKLPPILKPVANEVGVVRTIRLDCAGKQLGQVRAWFVPARIAKSKRAADLPDPLAITGTTTVIKLIRKWPSSNPKDDQAKLPSALIQQLALRRDASGRPTALVVTTVVPRAITSP